MMELGPVGLLLTFARRGEEETITRAITLLREECVSHVAAVGTEISIPMLESLGVDSIIPFGAESGRGAVLHELRLRHSVCAAIVYFDASHRGHLKLEMLALLSGARRVFRIAPEGAVTRLGRGQLLALICVKSLATIGVLCGAAGVCGIAYCWLRLRQLLTRGCHADRA
jgi:hypothetical protein